ncbi:hypothetical protein CVS40_2983 [Lucilia cuprina]|nr:hypothetical protein CVS40_2983 [Lucilia cuprina]
MDSLSKNVFLIGILHILGHIFYSLEPLTRSISMIYFKEYDDNQLRSTEFIFHLCTTGYSVLMIILAALMIRGVIKQCYLLLSPFFIFTSFTLGVLIVMFLLRIFGEYKILSFHFYQDHLYTIGIHIMFLYPVYTLFVKLRLKNLKEKNVALSFS